MNDVNLTEEDRQAVSEVYNQYQENNQKAHDLARDQLAEEHGLDLEEAEAHPEMEQRFEAIRENMASKGIVSIDPNTGEPGTRIPRPKPSPQAKPQFQVMGNPPQQGVDFEAGAIEQLLLANGLTILQSASDYTQGIITIVVTKQ